MQLTDNINHLVSHVEKVKYAVALGDQYITGICLLVLLVASTLATVCLWILFCLSDHGGMRYFAWLAGSACFLPLSMRDALKDAGARAIEKNKEVLGDKMGRMLDSFWQRIPDGIEACHVDLCE